MLHDGRIVAGDSYGHVMVWNPNAPGSDPVELERRDSDVLAIDAGVLAAVVLRDGRVVTGERGGRVLLWDPDAPGAGPIELGRHDRWVWAMAVLEDGRVVTGDSEGQVLVWNPATGAVGPDLTLASSCHAVATSPASTPGHADLVIAHIGSGLSAWSLLNSALAPSHREHPS